jgi:integrase/recombinase XerD
VYIIVCITHPILVSIIGGGTMLKELIDNFINYLIITNKSNETIIGYRKELRYFLEFIQEKLNCRVFIEDVTLSILEEYIAYIKEVKGCQPATINRAIHVLRSFYSYIVKRDIYSKNIPAMLEPIKLQQKERCYLSEKEFARLIAAIDNRLVYIIIKTLYYTGLRISECLDLSMDNIDMQNKLIHVIAGKGNKDRTIPVNNKLHKELSEYLKDIRPEGKSNRFFASETSGKVSREYINKCLKKAAKDAEINKNVTCHILRHSFASNLVSKNVNLVNVQKLLGHSSLKVTSIYTHTNIADLQKSVNML